MPGLRPTPDRVRETLFNWLGQDLSGWYCADPFAGTGALGFEAASRGAASVVLAETQAQCVIAMGKCKDRLSASQVKIQRTDGMSLLRQLPLQSQDLVFLDPPYDEDYQKIVENLLEKKYLNPKTLLVVEFEAKKFQKFEMFFKENFKIIDERKYGISFFGFYIDNTISNKKNIA